MASKKKTQEVTQKQEIPEVAQVPEVPEVPEVPQVPETVKFPVGSIVFVSKEAQADLNGFKLFPQYKKYTYTIEAYDAETDVYSLRRLNLSLKLKSADIVAPNEKEENPLVRKQY